MGVADRQSLWSNNRVLPKDCIPVAYLEFTSGSNAYIDTGIKPGNKGQWEFEVQINTNSGRSRFIGNNQLMVAAPDYATTWYPFHYNSGWNDTEMNISITQRHKVEYEFQPGLQHLYVDDVLKATGGNAAWSGQSDDTVTLFRVMASSGSSYIYRNVRIYYFKMYDENNNIICDLIPIKRNNIGCMFDYTTRQVFENLGSSSFIIGEELSNKNEGLALILSSINKDNWKEAA